MSSFGVGVSTTVRMYYRQYYAQRDVRVMQMRNAQLNEVIASDFLGAERIHRFKLRSGEIADIRKDSRFYMIGVVRGRGTTETRLDVIVIQPRYREAPEAIRKERLKPGWGAE